MFTFTRKQNVYTTALAVGLALAFVALSASAASTISTNITTNGSLTVDTTSTLTGNVTAGADLTVTSGARIGTGSTGTNITALADDTLFVEGAAEIDGITWADGGLVSNASSTVNSTLTVSGIFQASSTAWTTGVLNAVGGLISNASSTVGSTLNVSGVFQASSTALVGNGLRVSGGTLGVGATSTPGQEVGVVGDVLASSAATTTLFVDSTDAESGGCIQMRGTDGKWYRIYIVATTTFPHIPTPGLFVEPGICQTP